MLNPELTLNPTPGFTWVEPTNAQVEMNILEMARNRHSSLVLEQRGGRRGGGSGGDENWVKGFGFRI